MFVDDGVLSGAKCFRPRRFFNLRAENDIFRRGAGSLDLKWTSELPRTEGGWRTILADPPWHEQGSGRCIRGAQKYYPLMSEEAICAIPVREIVADQAHLYLWATNNHFPSALRVMETWDFTYKTCITWAKTSAGFGLGQYFRGMTEHCLFGTRGPNLPYRKKHDGKRAQGTTLILAPAESIL